MERFLAVYETVFGGQVHIESLFRDVAPKAVHVVVNYVNVAAPCGSVTRADTRTFD